MINANSVTFSIGHKTILKDVSITIRPGLMTAVLGPNGAGKTTLLRILAGELKEDGGEIHFEDRLLGDWTPKALALRRAVLPQASNLWFPFIVRDVVLMGRMPHEDGIEREREEDIAIVREALDLVDLGEFETRNYVTLSGGERQRVHLARVLSQVWGVSSGESKYLFLDEPTSNLDLLHQHSILRIARRWAERGAGVLVVLHDLNLAMNYVDEVILLNEGERVACGRADEILVAETLEPVFRVRIKVISVEGREKRLIVIDPKDTGPIES